MELDRSELCFARQQQRIENIKYESVYSLTDISMSSEVYTSSFECCGVSTFY